jgi:hypothetical protein
MGAPPLVTLQKVDLGLLPYYSASGGFVKAVTVQSARPDHRYATGLSHLERRIRIFPIWYKIASSLRLLSTYFCRIWQEQKSEFFHRNANAFALRYATNAIAFARGPWYTNPS